MRRLFAGGTCMAVALAVSMVASAQTGGQTPPQPQPQATQPEQQVTIVGCVQREADYRRAHNLGRGGAVGSGAGIANEFVLVNASPAPGTTMPGATAGTTGTTTPSETAFELTGKNESEADKYVGRRVEIVGKLKPAEVGTTGPTGGATAGKPPAGVDVTSPDLKLRELEIMTVRETTGTCPAMPPR